MNAMAKSAVSTHSRPKAAGGGLRPAQARVWSFNTQPPEGGWVICYGLFEALKCFNTQPPEGGWMA